jgi:hypothetical protein
VSLPDALEAAAGALPAEADAIRPANGDATRLLATLSAEGAARVASWLLAHRPADAEELAELWCEEPKGQAALLGVDEAGLPKQSRKLLRRLHHRLRSRGVATPAPAPAPTVARLPEVEEALSGGFVTTLDPMGTRQVWWLESHPASGTKLFECAIDDARGVLAFEVYTPTRSDLRRFLKSLSAGANAAVFPVDAATAKALVAKAAERQATDRSAPRRWVEWRGRLGPAGATALPGALASEALGALASEALGASQDRDALDAAAKLVSDGRVGPWPPARTALALIVERFRSALDSPLVVSGSTRREQVSRQVEEAAQEVFAGDAAALAAHRFRESAFCFWRRGEESEARACLAAAAAFEQRPGRENPVAHAFVELWLRPLLSAASGEPPTPTPEPEPSLVVRP